MPFAVPPAEDTLVSDKTSGVVLVLLVIMPLFADQFANARTLADAGAAVIVEPAGLRAAILSPPPPPERIAREIRSAPAPLTALLPRSRD